MQKWQYAKYTAIAYLHKTNNPTWVLAWGLSHEAIIMASAGLEQKFWHLASLTVTDYTSIKVRNYILTFTFHIIALHVTKPLGMQASMFDAYPKPKIGRVAAGRASGM